MTYGSALVILALALLHLTAAPTVFQPATVRLAVLDMGEAGTGVRAPSQLSKALAGAQIGGLRVALTDRDMSRAAARGVGYRGSLNMTLSEARDLGAAVGCDFFVTGDAQTLRRSSSARPVYFESYASVFVASSRTGRLIRWERPAAEAATPGEAERLLLAQLDAAAARLLSAVAEARAREDRERLAPPQQGDAHAPIIDLSAEEPEVAHGNVRPPAPYRRIRPAYTEEAARAEAEATVDASVEIGADGRVTTVEIVRWAGFGLDDSVASAVSRTRFRPAERGGEPVPVRVLLRYNFRRPQKKE